MAATNLYMNWSGVIYTPGAGSATSFTEVVSISCDFGSDKQSWSADADTFAKLIVTRMNRRVVTLTCGAVNQLMNVVKNSPGSLVFILNDALNVLGTGAITFTLANCIPIETPLSGSHNQFGGGTITFEGYAANGTSDPLSFVVA